ncbi:hypothetical protein V5799_026480, partial [Amblyomma americanum]
MPSSILCDHRLLSVLTWAEIDDLMLPHAERWLLKGEISVDYLEYEMRLQRESELLRYRSRHGLLDINNIEKSLFKYQFRFEKDDITELLCALMVPNTVTSAQNVKVPGREALCLTIRRLAYPNRWCDLERIFGRHTSVMSSITSKMLNHITANFGHLLKDINNHEWLSPPTLREFAN